MSSPRPSTTDCASVIKRGYLQDKKQGILPGERKRWYILRQDLAQGYCVLEYYKDEKTASKGEPPKGFINVHSVVEATRVVEKKQTFQILCPGVGYRFMANSEAETDEWVGTLRKLILYRKGDAKALSLQRMQHGQAAVPQIPARSRSDSHPPMSLAIPSSPGVHSGTPPDPSSSSFYHHQLSQSPSSRGPIHNLPTPPDSTASPPLPTVSLVPPLHQQKASELMVPLPSPSTSSDSSSMCSGSNTSFETGVGDGGESDSRSRFRVHVKEAENLSVAGPADLVLSEDGITLHSVQTGQELVAWPIGSLRRYGVNNICFTIFTGRYCATGEGQFEFYTQQSRAINSRLHTLALQKAQGKGSLPRRSSEPATISDVISRSPQQTTAPHYLYGGNPTHSLPAHYLGGTSPPTQYAHIHHMTMPPGSSTPSSPFSHLEQYSKLGATHATGMMATAANEYSRLHHSCSLAALPTHHAPTSQPISSHCVYCRSHATHPPHLTPHHLHTLPISHSSSSNFAASPPKYYPPGGLSMMAPNPPRIGRSFSGESGGEDGATSSS